jgi:ubiquinone/menaquinone biosynthesis C-methylase UbiE
MTTSTLGLDDVLSAPRSLSPGAALYAAKQGAVSAFLGGVTTLLHKVAGAPEPVRNARMLASLAALHTDAVRADYEDAKADLYPMSLLVPLPGWHDIRFLPEVILDAPRIISRRKKGDFHVDATRVTADAGTSVPLPDYYRRTFHWQTDGWMSEHSARLYELQVELLFGGCMDLMRRRPLAALIRALGGDRKRMRVRVLDVACGTGRFLEQARAALPEAKLEGVDLSPFYLERAQARLEGDSAARFRVANAESLGGGDDVYDAVTSVFLFHELPRDARRNVAREMFRVLEPGGVLVVCDSMQRMDPNGKALEPFLDWFPKAYHEPYYKGYVEDELGAMFEEVGFKVAQRSYALTTKIVVAKKPPSS